MTEAMVQLARKNALDAGVANVEFLLGTMEFIPLPDDSVDVVISNCVINLAANKDLVLREAYRVLKKGGKLAVFDIVLSVDAPESIHEEMKLWTGCVAGALSVEDYTLKLHGAGFEEVTVEAIRIYTQTDVKPT